MLAVCVRRLSSVGSSANQGAAPLRNGVCARVNVAGNKSSQVVASSSKSSLVKVAMRKYAEAAPSAEADAATKKWNIELNRLYKLRYYEEAIAAFKKMKEEGVSPNSVTYMIMYDTFGNYHDENALAGLVAEVKAKGIKCYLLEKDIRMREIMGDDSRESALEVVDIQSQMMRYKQAGLNPFDPLK